MKKSGYYNFLLDSVELYNGFHGLCFYVYYDLENEFNPIELQSILFAGCEVKLVGKIKESFEQLFEYMKEEILEEIGCVLQSEYEFCLEEKYQREKDDKAN